jgi:DNA topoisomerase-1
LNLAEDAPRPEGAWAGIIHDQDSMWLAKWVDKLTTDTKYVWLSEASLLRRKRDKEKYDLAARLQDRIERVRKLILKGMRSRDERERKTASVCFLIDKLAMRVGDEKDEDEADTVGASTLRVEHVKIQDHQIHFDFLGKDSVRWQKIIALNKDGEDEIALRNFRSFIQGKGHGDLLFDGINSSAVNRFLSKGMRGLTAKVFRTYEATTTVRQYLQRQGQLDGEGSLHLKLYHAKMANLEAAIRCNHKRTPPKNWVESLSKKEEVLKRLLASETRTPRQTEALKERIEKTHLSLDLAKATKDYNVGTSLKNYVDPRVYKSWADHVGLDWKLLYTKSLQKKFGWVERLRLRWQPSG